MMDDLQLESTPEQYKLQEALQHCWDKLSKLSPGDPDLAECLGSVSDTFALKYEWTRERRDQEMVLKFSTAAVAATPASHLGFPVTSRHLGMVKWAKFDKTDELQDLEAVFNHFLSAVGSMPGDHPTLPRLQKNLSEIYGTRFIITRNLGDLDTALKYLQLAIAATPEGHLSLPRMLYNLGVLSMHRIILTGNQDDLDATLSHLLMTIAGIPEKNPDLTGIYHNLGLLYNYKFQKFGELKDLRAAHKYALKAISATSIGDLDLPHMCLTMGSSYSDFYKIDRDIKNLRMGLKFILAAVDATPDDHSNLPHIVQNLCKTCSPESNIYGTLESMRILLSFLLATVDVMPKKHLSLVDIHRQIGVLCGEMYKKTGLLSDLDDSIKHNMFCVAMGTKVHSSLYQNLGGNYGERYRRTGDLDDMDTALKYFLIAVGTAPLGHSGLSAIHQNLGTLYLDRYKRFTDLQDLEAALRFTLVAIAATPEAGMDLPLVHTHLGSCYQYRYARIGNPDDLESALKFHWAAVEGTPVGHHSLPGLHQNLGGSHMYRFEKMGNVRDLDIALHYLQAAATSIPVGHLDLPAICQALGNCYTNKYKHTGKKQDLEAAISHQIKGVNTTPVVHPTFPQQLSGLARLYALRFEAYRNVEDLNLLYYLYKCALQSQTASPQDLWDISIQFSHHMNTFTGQPNLEGYSAALKILPSLLWLGSPLTNRCDILVRHKISNFISEAVTMALKALDTRLAVEFLEQGMSITHKQTLQLRDEHAMLEAHFPSLSKRLYQISVQLQGPFQRSNSAINYHALAHERQKLICEIQQQPGFEDFLLLPKYPKLCTAAKHGPIIMLNYSHIQTDCIILISPSTAPVHLALHGVSALTVEKYTHELQEALNHVSIHSRELRHGRLYDIDQSLSNKLLHSVIDWLWTAIVKPVFDLLLESGIKSGRLWWCPSGPFTYFPLHAAAPQDSSFIQSYIPTLDFLVHANIQCTKDLATMTVVGIVKPSTDTGFWVELPFVDTELDTVAELFEPQCLQLRGSQATIDNVVTAIQSSSWLHLACHAYQDLPDPLSSGLIVFNGKLELEKILNLKIPKAKFVYLSACETAMGDSKLTNEAMHLAGGFLAIGFRGAIGTLWSMADAHGPKVAKIVYETILGEDKLPDMYLAAKGLHIAIQKLRAEGTPFHQWMPFVHIGI